MRPALWSITSAHLGIEHNSPLVAGAVDAVGKVRSLVHESEVLVHTRVSVDPSDGGDGDTAMEEKRSHARDRARRVMETD